MTHPTRSKIPFSVKLTPRGARQPQKYSISLVLYHKML